VRTRQASDDDWGGIWPVWRAAVSTGESYPWDPDTDETAARALWMLPPPAEVLVVEDDDVPGISTIVATALLTPNLPGAGSHVANAVLMAYPDLLGSDVGRMLAEDVIDRAVDLGYRAMQFNAVVAANSRLVAFWRALAFRVIGTVPAGFRHPWLGDVDLYVMHRFLPVRDAGPRRAR
jgi:GNAT superfamily N-acetyltransferase